MHQYIQKTLFHLEDILKSSQEPFIDVGDLPDLLDAVATSEGSINGENALVRRVQKLFVDVIDNIVLCRKSFHISNPMAQKR